MKQLRLRMGLWAVVAAVSVGHGLVQAQTIPQDNSTQQRRGEALRIEKPQGSLSGPTVNRPGLPESMPQVIRDRLLEFEQRREQYLAQQLELVHQLHKVSDAERAQLREQLREQRQAWLEEAKKIREQARARLQEMKKELSNHGEVIEAAREQAREQIREQVREQIRDQVRERRGTE
jgi:vacuolar-type H+-ATPase subunit H